MQELILYTQDAPELPAEKITTWTLVARGKAKMDDMLRKDGILLESFLNSEDPDLAERVKQYKNVYGVMQNHRKEFTVVIDAVKDMCMATEKLYDPKSNSRFLAMESAELTERKRKADEQNAKKGIAEEELRFRSHVTNQYIIMATAYKQQLMEIAFQCKQHCLAAKTPADNVQNAINLATKAMQEVQPQKVAPFNFVHLKQADIQRIASEIPVPQLQTYMNDAYNALISSFELYANELANAEQVLESAKKIHEEEVAEVVAEAEQEVVSNNLVAQAGVYIGDEVKIKSKTAIKILDDNKEFIVRICSAFVANFQVCIEHVGVKKLSNLNVKQMAVALDDAGVVVKGVEYVTTEK